MGKSLRKKRAKAPAEPVYLSSGSTLLNLACTGRVDGALRVGHYYLYVGDSNSGKTWLAHTLFAEACINPAFDEYRMIYDAVEGGALMDVERFFGKSAAERIEPPERSDDGLPVFSDTSESFYFHVADAIDVGAPFIYVLDSQDSLSSDAEKEKFGDDRKAHKAGKEASGTYGDNKAKVHSAKLRRLLSPLKESGSILLILNQTRDSFDIFQPSSYSGGRALTFYATLQLWSSKPEQIKKMVRGKPRQVGIRAKIRVRKNRETGRDRTAVVPIFSSVGIDDVGSCIDYLVNEKVWKKSKSGVIEVSGIGPSFTGRMEDVVKKIEDRDLEGDLREKVGEVWDEVEKACEIKRKRRYG
jgi:RecA/RadA recombinase